MIIPKLHYISQGNNPKLHLEHIQKACSFGAELVQLRLKDLSEKEVLKTAKEAREITAHFQTRLIINDYYKIAKEIKADGVHLGKTDTSPSIAKKQLYSWQIIGGTANTIEDCRKLIAESVDYIGLGPFKYTRTKKNLSPTLGLNGYTKIVETLEINVPIIAVGGITVKDVKNILETGITGVAISGEITRDFNTIKTLNQLLNASLTQEQRYTFNENE